jgi:hypothetical protein
VTGRGLLEQVFALTYCVPGITWDACMEMHTDERQWLLKRLHKQQKAEAEAIGKAK